MKVNEVHSATSAQIATATAEASNAGTSPPVAGVAGVPTPPQAEPAPPSPDKVSTTEAAHLKNTVASATKMAAGERALRLQTLTQQVRSGNYRPNVSQLATQILAQAELEAHLAKDLH